MVEAVLADVPESLDHVVELITDVLECAAAEFGTDDGGARATLAQDPGGRFRLRWGEASLIDVRLSEGFASAAHTLARCDGEIWDVAGNGREVQRKEGAPKHDVVDDCRAKSSSEEGRWIGRGDVGRSVGLEPRVHTPIQDVGFSAFHALSDIGCSAFGFSAFLEFQELVLSALSALGFGSVFIRWRG